MDARHSSADTRPVISPRFFFVNTFFFTKLMAKPAHGQSSITVMRRLKKWTVQSSSGSSGTGDDSIFGRPQVGLRALAYYYAHHRKSVVQRLISGFGSRCGRGVKQHSRELQVATC
jgi:hypothetical protein